MESKYPKESNLLLKQNHWMQSPNQQLNMCSEWSLSNSSFASSGKLMNLIMLLCLFRMDLSNTDSILFWKSFKRENDPQASQIFGSFSSPEWQLPLHPYKSMDKPSNFVAANVNCRYVLSRDVEIQHYTQCLAKPLDFQIFRCMFISSCQHVQQY